MDSLFLRELPVVSLADGKPKTFIVDFPESRPSIEHVKLMVDKWRAQNVKHITEAMKRKNCAVSYVQFAADKHGSLVIVCFNHPVILGAAKTAVGAIFKCLPKETAHGEAEEGLRPLDDGR